MPIQNRRGPCHIRIEVELTARTARLGFFHYTNSERLDR